MPRTSLTMRVEARAGRGRAGSGNGNPLADLVAGRDQGPVRTATSEDRDGGMEPRRAVERARIDGEEYVLADLATEDELAADGTETAHGVLAVGGLGGEGQRRTAEAHVPRWKPDERDGARAQSVMATRPSLSFLLRPSSETCERQRSR